MPGQLHVRLRMKLPNDARSVALARRLVRCALGSLDVTEDCTDDLVLAVSEACTNVLDHAGLDQEYEVVAGIDGSRCVLEIADDGPGIAVRPRAAVALDDLDAESGRGLRIIETLVDSVEFSPGSDCGLVVRMCKELVYRAA
jgi:serine/threonine-protein kinase RsbW